MGVYGSRLLALVAYCAAVATLYLVVSPVLPFSDHVETPATAAPARPASVPARVPAWAWDLLEWELTEPVLRGYRPSGAPLDPPRWYAEWRAWRVAVSR
jgi:hypothetical protein